jgi:hypothetical protein
MVVGVPLIITLSQAVSLLLFGLPTVTPASGGWKMELGRTEVEYRNISKKLHTGPALPGKQRFLSQSPAGDPPQADRLLKIRFIRDSIR